MRYKYEIIRTPRKGISVSITNENKITVRCPWSMHIEEVEAFLDSKTLWIEKVVTRNAARLALNDDVVEHKKVYVEGKKLPLVIGDKNQITAEAVYVKKLDDLEKVYKEKFQEGLNVSVKALSELTLLTPASVSIKGYKGRWGCCDTRNNLIFNYMLFMLPPEIQRYVIVHELCHTLCHNHSAAFWKLVSDYVPNYKKLRSALREYDFLTSLY